MDNVLEFLLIEMHRCRRVAYDQKKNGDYVLEEYYKLRQEKFNKAISILKNENKDQS